MLSVPRALAPPLILVAVLALAGCPSGEPPPPEVTLPVESPSSIAPITPSPEVSLPVESESSIAPIYPSEKKE